MRFVVLAWLIAAGGVVEAGAAGSWADGAPRLRVSLVDRETPSEALAPSGGEAAGRRIRDLRWRYRAPPGAGLRARLCHPGGCIRLPGPRGYSQAPAGLPAGQPWRFHFSLAPGQAPVTVEGLQVIVNYR